MLKLSLFLRLRLSLILVIATALINTGSWSFLLIYGIIALSWCLFLSTPFFSLIKLLGAELIFLSLMALPLGWQKASFLLLRSLICLLIMNSFLLTVPKYHLSIALKGLPLPLKMQEIIILTAEYLEILLSEVKQMHTAAKLRGLKGNSQWLRYISSAMIGSLYLRSLDRADRVYNAMLIRGYHGTLPIEIKSSKAEKFILIMIAVILTILTSSSYTIWFK
ncbi:energy-coupling factor transporter transmembrane component T [Geminocystis sp. GBBB08]|uniref:energy-coupling factor transporter transmembrane component T family protein n=1 Tax=Geminocystis sp. GBBB08 TaxID=2604140 RepID=UPI0027E39C19|nr:energy-coupling factor transporter transmembrane component T [Geminocystis sp. GBBB08]MBL1209049.1 energy-coupling factor transporter transmembrane protein EcfT [Geminocystis sp. GBBB08]